MTLQRMFEGDLLSLALIAELFVNDISVQKWWWRIKFKYMCI